jgi:cyclophilin family peptidyl-prolyl cis-trans isomerase
MARAVAPLTSFLALLMLAAPGGRLLGEEKAMYAPVLTAEQQKHLETLIAQLSSANAAQRARAEADLLQFGPAARGMLGKLAEGGQGEAAAAAKRLLAHPAYSPDLPRVRIVLERGNIELVLLEDAAPNTVRNFIQLAEKKYYDGLLFHRVIENFMAQGGDPTGTGRGGPGYKFADEISAEALGLDKMTAEQLAEKTGQRLPPSAAGLSVKQLYERQGYRYTPGLASWPIKRGVLAMANSGPNTNGSQFFITHRDCDWLNGKHTVFGIVTKGQDLVDTMAGNEKMLRLEVLFKRNHAYEVSKIGE